MSSFVFNFTFQLFISCNLQYAQSDNTFVQFRTTVCACCTFK